MRGLGEVLGGIYRGFTEDKPYIKLITIICVYIYMGTPPAGPLLFSLSSFVVLSILLHNDMLQPKLLLLAISDLL